MRDTAYYFYIEFPLKKLRLIRRPLHCVELATLFSTFRLGYLRKYPPCAFSLNALRLLYSARFFKMIGFTCLFGTHATVSSNT